MQGKINPFDAVAGWLQENVVLPVLYAIGHMELEEWSYGWTLFAIYGVAQVLVAVAICWPLEKYRPIEIWQNKKVVWVDVFYTMISRVGILPVITFVCFSNVQMTWNGWLADNGWMQPTLEQVFPFFLGKPILSFLVYALILDFSEYWRHRFSHAFDFWYSLHSLHHAQRQMSFWSDDRNHILDDVIGFVWFSAIALAIGVPPMQFPLLVLALRLVESLSHANTKLSYGWLGERVLVSPRFHRTHHGLLAAGSRSVNYGAVFPYWDIIFGTANFEDDTVQTGDPTADEALATGTYIEQQIAGFKRLLGFQV